MGHLRDEGEWRGGEGRRSPPDEFARAGDRERGKAGGVGGARWEEEAGAESSREFVEGMQEMRGMLREALAKLDEHGELLRIVGNSVQ